MLMGLPDSDIPAAFLAEGDQNGRELSETEKRRAYARHYMEKLINLEISIPKLNAKSAASMAKADEEDILDTDLDWVNKRRPRLNSVLNRAGRLLKMIIVGFVIFKAYGHVQDFYNNAPQSAAVQPEGLPAAVQPEGLPNGQTGLETSNRTGDISNNNRAGLGIGERGTPNITLETETRDIREADILQQRSSKSVLAESVGIAPTLNASDDWLNVILLSLFILALLLLALSFFIRQIYVASDNIETDPQSFLDALAEANKVMGSLDSTPRAVKLFMNRMRFASTRMRKINYQTGLLDWIAARLGWVSNSFEQNAISKSPLDDRALIGIGLIDRYLGKLPANRKEAILLLQNQRSGGSDSEKLLQFVRNIELEDNDFYHYRKIFYNSQDVQSH